MGGVFGPGRTLVHFLSARTAHVRREIVIRVRVQVPQQSEVWIHTPRFSDVVSHHRPLLNSSESSRWAREVPGMEWQHTRHPHCAGSRRAC